MEFCFKSSILKRNEKRVVFHTDLTSLKIKEEEWDIDDSLMNGFLREIHLNRLFILYQDYKSDREQFLELEVDEPIFKLHFELKGKVMCHFSDEQQTSTEIAKGMYNMFYLPVARTCYKNKGLHKSSLEIFFTESYLQNTLGYCFTGKSEKLRTSKLNKKPCLFYKDGNVISNQIGLMVKDIIHCSFEGLMKKAFLEAKVTELLLFSLTRNFKKSSEIHLNEADANSLKIVEKHIKEHLSSELTIAELSLLAGFNTSKFKQYFKEYFGTTVFKYITLQRVEKAKELIQKEGISIAQASSEVGYKNPQHFTVAFKRVLGYLPSQIKDF